MRILYLSKNLKKYKAANYQIEFLKALSKKKSLFVYGPGHSNFDKNKNLSEIIELYGPFDLIFVGHAWLDDGITKTIDPWPNSGLSKLKIKKFFFLNKEYINLNKKLNWIKKNNFKCVFSHYQNCKIWEKRTKTKFRFLPFAYDKKYFFYSQKKRKYDLAFSGILQNMQKEQVQSDIRIRILKRIYFTIFNIPVFKRKKFRHLSIFWNSTSTSFLNKFISKVFKTYKFLSIDHYAKIQRNSKIYINSKSPMNLLSPRYLENIASGCFIITEKNKELEKLIPTSAYKEFSKDLSNFDKVLFQSLEKYDYSKKIIRKNSKIVKKIHTWDNRVEMVLKFIRTIK